MKSSTVLKAEVRDVANKMLSIAHDDAIPTHEKAAKLKGYQPQLEHAQAELVDVEHVEKQLNILRGAGVSGDQGGSGATSALPYSSKSLHAAPSIMPSENQLRSLHDAIRSRKSYRVDVDTKTTTDVSSMLPPTRIPGVVTRQHEPQRVLDFIPSAPIGSPTWEYFRHASTTGAPTTVAPGGLKPEISFAVDTVTGTVRKIAAQTAVEDETLADFEGFAGYVSAEMTRQYIDVENGQLLTGDGTGTNILGLLNETGILNRDYTADHTADASGTGLDTLERAITDLRVGSAFATADLVVMHPTTWSALRRTKNSQGNYLLGDPSEMGPANLWSIPVITTTSIPVGTALVAQMSLAGEARIRQGVTIESTPYNADDWTHNLTRFRIEARIGLAVVRPAAISKVVNL